MTLTKNRQSEHNVSGVQGNIQLTPLLARQLANEVCAAWDEIQPMEQPWRDLLRGRSTAATALKNLNELAQPSFGKTEEQCRALSQMRLLLDALACRGISESDLPH